MNWKLALLPALIILPLLLVLASGFGNDPHALPSVLLQKPAPDFQLENLNGEAMHLASLRGTPVVLNFWSTWCEPCKVEHDILQRGSQHFGDTVRFIGIIYQDTPEKARVYLNQRSNVFPQLIDPNSKIAIQYGVSGVPESFIIDAQGKIVHKEMGVVTPKLLVDTLTPLIATAAQNPSPTPPPPSPVGSTAKTPPAKRHP